MPEQPDLFGGGIRTRTRDLRSVKALPRASVRLVFPLILGRSMVISFRHYPFITLLFRPGLILDDPGIAK